MNLQSYLLMFLLAFSTLPLNTGFSERGGEGVTGNEYRERQNEKKKKKKRKDGNLPYTLASFSASFTVLVRPLFPLVVFYYHPLTLPVSSS